jgi:KDO2-lipid IV(A) lauroyltransferase
VNLSYYLYRVSGAVVPYIPPVVGYAFCRFIAGVVYHFNRRGRTSVQLNLRRIMGEQCSEAEIRRRSRLTFNYILYNYFDLFRLPYLDDQTINRLVTVEGWENVEAALSQGRGVIMTSAHLGNIELVLYAMRLRGLSIMIPVERVTPPELFQYITRLRSSKGLRLIPVDGPLLDLLRMLKKGGVVGLAGDRDITGSGQVTHFFGHPARLPDGHIRLALRAKAPLVLGFSRRNPDHTYSAYFLPAFFPSPAATEEEQVNTGFQFVIRELEKAIRQNPEQWVVTVSIWID